MAYKKINYTAEQINTMFGGEATQNSNIASLQSGKADKSEIPSVPTKTSQLTNDSGFISQVKTINGESIEGEGNITIPGGGGGANVYDGLDSDSTTSALSAKQGKVLDGRTRIHDKSFFPADKTIANGWGASNPVIPQVKTINKITLYASQAATISLRVFNSTTSACRELTTFATTKVGAQTIVLDKIYKIGEDEMYYLVGNGLAYKPDSNYEVNWVVEYGNGTGYSAKLANGYLEVIAECDLSVMDVAMANTDSLSTLTQEVASNKTDCDANASNITKLTANKAADKYQGLNVIFAGDSYAHAANVNNGYIGDFSRLHSGANVVMGAWSGRTMLDILNTAKTHFSTYSKIKTSAPYGLITTETTSLVKAIVTDATQVQSVRFNFTLDSGSSSLGLYIISYNSTTNKQTELKYVTFSSIFENQVVEHNFTDVIKAKDGEVLMLLCNGGSIKYVADDTHTFVGGQSRNSLSEVSGSPLCQLESERLHYYIIEGGLNDYYGNVPIGSIREDYSLVESDYDTTTFCGRVEQLLMLLRRDLISTRCGFIIMHQADASWRNYASKIIDACNKWGIPYLDLDSTIGVAMRKTSTLYNTIYRDWWLTNADGTMNYHPSRIAYKQIDGEIFSFIDRL